MTYVITQPCIGVKDASCVDVCPVDCIHPTQSEAEFETAEQLYINPDECIDCGACEPECPVGAIFPEEDVPVEWQGYIALNAGAFQQGRGIGGCNATCCTGSCVNRATSCNILAFFLAVAG